MKNENVLKQILGKTNLECKYTYYIDQFVSELNQRISAYEYIGDNFSFI